MGAGGYERSKFVFHKKVETGTMYITEETDCSRDKLSNMLIEVGMDCSYLFFLNLSVSLSPLRASQLIHKLLRCL